VVAIIAILAAIAVPNFLEAQVRTKVTAVRNDFRTMNVAMQAYRIDHNDYPPDNLGTSWYNDWYPFIVLTTPLAYITSIPTNPFFDNRLPDGLPRGNYSYWRDYGDWGARYENKELGIFYAITSVGPDRTYQMEPVAVDVFNRAPSFLNALYDSTNGTRSAGDLHCSNIGISF